MFWCFGCFQFKCFLGGDQVRTRLMRVAGFLPGCCWCGGRTCVVAWWDWYYSDKLLICSSELQTGQDSSSAWSPASLVRERGGEGRGGRWGEVRGRLGGEIINNYHQKIVFSATSCQLRARSSKIAWEQFLLFLCYESHISAADSGSGSGGQRGN